MASSGQGAIEYLLLIGAAILVVAVVIVAVTSVVVSGRGDTNSSVASTAIDGLKNLFYSETFNNNSEFHSGSGTAQNPYTISNWKHLDNMKFHPDGNYVLLNDLDETTYGYNGIGNNWTPIGITFDESDKTYCGGEWLDGVYGYDYSNCEFTGTFDGNNHTIKRLTISFENPKRVGLFGKTNGATISNIGLIDVNIYRGESFVGGLIGNSHNSTINNAYTTGNIKGSGSVGGLIGFQAYGSINKSNSTANVTGDSYVGGLVGYVENSTISKSYVEGNIVGKNRVGGLVGSQSNGATNNSYAKGSLTVTDDVGYGGGIIGSMFGSASVENSYSAIDLSSLSNNNVGGLFWRAGSETKSNYNYFDKEKAKRENACSDLCWGRHINIQYAPKTTTQMKQQSTFTDWDFTNIWDINTSYPFLR